MGVWCLKNINNLGNIQHLVDFSETEKQYELMKAI